MVSFSHGKINLPAQRGPGDGVLRGGWGAEDQQIAEEEAGVGWGADDEVVGAFDHLAVEAVEQEVGSDAKGSIVSQHRVLPMKYVGAAGTDQIDQSFLLLFLQKKKCFACLEP
ncbi:hypothetical protein AruPA_00205 [Acidiphilium sp. PA]|uniref:hypothetical protein n=1 Tax=Acidiphilium sp. PA TaxID=2871705 RepID=UPI002242E24A|nr:hypothetical protein [Acidiphilium sp. PA]MCW8305442.1 hypothetical protein [Acidiphilium sp. PA]